MINPQSNEFSEQVHKLALENKHPRQTVEDQAAAAMMPRYKYERDFQRRCLNGEALSFLEVKYYLREKLTHDKWKVWFYEVIQFPQTRFFDTEKEARNYWKKIKMRKTLKAQKATLEKPAEHIFGDRSVEETHDIEKQLTGAK